MAFWNKRKGDTPAKLLNTGSEQQHQLAQLLGLLPQSNVTYVTASTVVGLPALDAGVNLISNAVAQMLKAASVVDAQGEQMDFVPPIVSRPNVLIPTSEFWQQCARSLLIHGNYIAIITQNQLVPVHPDAVSLDMSSGLPIYTIQDRDYRWDRVLHIRKDAPVGTLWGQGIVDKFRTTLEGVQAQQNFGTSSYTGIPGGLLKFNVEDLTDKQRNSARDAWTERFANGNRGIAVIPGLSTDFTPLSWSPIDAEYVNSRKLTIAEAAYMCGLNPSDLEASLGGAGSLTYGNLTDRELARIVSAYAPVYQLIEEALSDLLPQNMYVKASPEALLRNTTRERYELVQLAQEIGVEDELTDEVLE